MKKAPHFPQIVFFLPFSCPSPFGRPDVTGTNCQGSLGNAVCRVPAPKLMVELRSSREMKGLHVVDGPGGMPGKEEKKSLNRTSDLLL